MKRYNVVNYDRSGNATPGRLEEFALGQLVKYDDHAAEVAGLKARIAELEEELGGWVKSFDDVNARCIALSERYES